MEAEKIRNLTDDELRHEERNLADQLFKLKFQMNMGQTESLKKIRGLRRDIARVQTIGRERELSGAKAGGGAAAKGHRTAARPAAPKAAKRAATTGAKTAAKTATAGKTAAAAKTERK